ncbi:MAG: hypothetical protein OXM56_12995 [Gammaproteobacteria bacterium]|nr:hypothetical protein [Gammaproteobacteria bacterium]
MIFLAAGIAAMAVLGIWLMRARTSRRQWLAELHLPGIWDLEDATSPVVLEFSGGNEQGHYVARSGGDVEEGEWRIAGRNLVMARDDRDDPVEYELRVFGPGSIGVHGPGRDREVYVRRGDNVVPIHRRS